MAKMMTQRAILKHLEGIERNLAIIDQFEDRPEYFGGVSRAERKAALIVERDTLLMVLGE